MEVLTRNKTLDDITLYEDRILLDYTDPTELVKSGKLYLRKQGPPEEGKRIEIWMQTTVAKLGTNVHRKDLDVGDSVIFIYANDEAMEIDGKKYIYTISQALIAKVNAPDPLPEEENQAPKAPPKLVLYT